MKFIKRFFKILIRIAGVLLIIIIAIYFFRAFQSRSLPDLKAWHTSSVPQDPLLDNPNLDIDVYLATEQTYLQEIYKEMHAADPQAANKYNPEHLSSPIRDGINLNGSFNLPPQGPLKGGILLAHGLTDSPYHLRDVAALFAEEGYYVICLRLPGHGSVPAALTTIKWADWYQAIEYGISALRGKIGGKTLYAGGFSTGGALVMHYTLQMALNDPAAMPEKLFLFSPAIEIDPLAEVADWHKLLSSIPWFEKFKWTDVEPEYDPFKYNSFPKNAGDQIFDLTVANKKLVKEVKKQYQDLNKLPEIISFQSVADATVRPEGLYDLYTSIGSPNSELILFDVNRFNTDYIQPGFVENLPQEIAAREGFVAKLYVVTNLAHDTLAESLTKETSLYQTQPAFQVLAGADTISWPANYFALSHVCIPIAPTDPVYGMDGFLGGLTTKGEKGVLTLSAENLIRIRYNPFYSFVEQKIRKNLP